MLGTGGDVDLGRTRRLGAAREFILACSDVMARILYAVARRLGRRAGADGRRKILATRR